MQILVTGNAGFIGSHVVLKLLERGDSVVGLDVVNDYYDPLLKEARLKRQAEIAGSCTGSYEFVRANLADRGAVESVFGRHKFDRVIHLAAQAGVRYSLENPRAYTESNIDGFVNIIECCRHSSVPHLTYASTSSVYGANTNMPFSEHRGVDHPLAMYAATKRANELMAHAYSHLFRLPTTGLRFFTVYGPWGRPDMALFLFTRNTHEANPSQVCNTATHPRDYPYAEDIVEGWGRASAQVPQPNPVWNSADPDPATSNAPFRIFNIGNNSPVKLMEYIEAIEQVLGKKAIKEMLPLQAGDVPDTYADVSELSRVVGYKPATPVREGVRRFVEWYLGFYRQS